MTAWLVVIVLALAIVGLIEIAGRVTTPSDGE